MPGWTELGVGSRKGTRVWLCLFKGTLHEMKMSWNCFWKEWWALSFPSAVAIYRPAKLCKENVFRCWKISQEWYPQEKKTYEVNLIFSPVLLLRTRQCMVILLSWRGRECSLVLLRQLALVRKNTGKEGAAMGAQKSMWTSPWVLDWWQGNTHTEEGRPLKS